LLQFKGLAALWHRRAARFWRRQMREWLEQAAVAQAAADEAGLRARRHDIRAGRIEDELRGTR
jgi:hypothetical protein